MSDMTSEQVDQTCFFAANIALTVIKCVKVVAWQLCLMNLLQMVENLSFGWLVRRKFFDFARKPELANWL
jgi:hypothetical protein